MLCQESLRSLTRFQHCLLLHSPTTHTTTGQVLATESLGCCVVRRIGTHAPIRAVQGLRHVAFEVPGSLDTCRIRGHERYTVLARASAYEVSFPLDSPMSLSVVLWLGFVLVCHCPFQRPSLSCSRLGDSNHHVVYDGSRLRHCSSRVWLCSECFVHLCSCLIEGFFLVFTREVPVKYMIFSISSPCLVPRGPVHMHPSARSRSRPPLLSCAWARIFRSPSHLRSPLWTRSSWSGHCCFGAPTIPDRRSVLSVLPSTAFLLDSASPDLCNTSQSRIMRGRLCLVGCS